jgi:hypothetical protein
MTDFVVVSTGFRCPEAARRCCASVSAAGLRHIYAAADGETFTAACETIGRGGIVHYSEKGQIENLVMMISEIPPEVVVIHLDGDDEIALEAPEWLAWEYRFREPWVTYGSFVTRDGLRDRDWDRAFGTRYLVAPRLERWRAAHLRTFRAGLFHSIPVGHLQSRPGSYFTTCVDRAIMLSLLELAGERYAVIQDVLCIYDQTHDRNMTAEQRALEAGDREAIHALPPLKPLAKRPW